MHMADALLSPAVGGAMWAATAGSIAYCSSRVKKQTPEWKIPLMGVMGAFVFTAQMISFTIPGTGSSGHLGGGLLLAILLGPHAAFLTLASVLVVQALFFADGGLLALGCNIFNLGAVPCFIAYPLIYKKILPNRVTQGRLITGSVSAAIVGLQIGAFGVVIQTILSGVTELSFRSFALLVQSIHLVIGLFEGLATAGLVSFIWKVRPDILEKADSITPHREIAIKKVAVCIVVSALLIGGVFSWFASDYPDGLEWSLYHGSGKKEIESPNDSVHSIFAQIQRKISFLPAYGFKSKGDDEGKPKARENLETIIESDTTLSGIIGGFLTLMFGVLVGLVLKKKQQQA